MSLLYNVFIRIVVIGSSLYYQFWMITNKNLNRLASSSYHRKGFILIRMVGCEIAALIETFARHNVSPQERLHCILTSSENTVPEKKSKRSISK